MTRNRKADLHRKLGMAPLPTPPSDLADRIKTAIPHDLHMNVENERAHLRRAVTFDVRIAASILLLISATFAGLHLMTRAQDDGAGRPSGEAADTSRIAQTRTIPDAAELHPPSALDGTVGAVPSAPPASPILRRRNKEEEGAPALATAKRSDIRAANDVPASNPALLLAAGSTVTPAAAPIAPLQTPPSRTERPTELAEVGAEKKEAAKTMAASARGSVAVASDAAMPSAPPALTDATSRGGQQVSAQRALSGGPVTTFAAAEQSVRSHQRVSRESAEALIEHFAAAVDLPARGIHVETEAITMRKTEPDVIFVRVSIDAAPGEAATDLLLTLDSDPAPHAGGTARETQPFAMHQLSGASVTKIYSLAKPSGVHTANSLALVRLRYRDGNGQDRTVERTVDDVHEWDTSSRRGQASSLTAALVMRLQGGKPLDGLAAMARRQGLSELAELIDSAARR